MKTFTKSEMLALWRQSLGLVTVNQSCTIEAVEGLDVDNLISRYMRLWYLNLLDTAPAHLWGQCKNLVVKIWMKIATLAE